MPMHDWTKVYDGVFHAFHHRWISAISDDLNSGRLPADYYALPEQVAAGLGPDVLTLQSPTSDGHGGTGLREAVVATAVHPTTRFMAESEGDFYRRKKSWITVRHVSGDRVVAVLEVVSPGNKSSDYAFHAFVRKVLELLERRIHLLLVDPLPAGPRDPNGIHGAIWGAFDGERFELPSETPLTLVAYECELTTRAYIEPIAIGGSLPDMPLYIEPGLCVMVPLEATYQAAYQVMPRRWRQVLEGA